MSPGALGVGTFFSSDVFSSLIAVLEAGAFIHNQIVPRGMWNIFRVETEHSANCAARCAARSFNISVPDRTITVAAASPSVQEKTETSGTYWSRIKRSSGDAKQLCLYYASRVCQRISYRGPIILH